MLKNEYKQSLVLQVAYDKKFGAAKNRPVPISDGVWICKEHSEYHFSLISLNFGNRMQGFERKFHQIPLRAPTL